MTDRRRGATVAVVDDDQSVLESLGILLESADHAVRLFASARAMLESGCLDEIDCLISDIGMPVMDGLELSRLVHAARPGFPIILVTGHPDLLNQSLPVGMGCCCLLNKPLRGEAVLAAVSDALRAPIPRPPRP